MEATSGGISSLFQSTKTKLLVLSSLLGVGAIYYMTRNYLRKGYLLPSWRAQKSIDQKDGSYKHPRVIGGKRAVSIREDDSIGKGMIFFYERTWKLTCWKDSAIYIYLCSIWWISTMMLVYICLFAVIFWFTNWHIDTTPLLKQFHTTFIEVLC